MLLPAVEGRSAGPGGDHPQAGPVALLRVRPAVPDGLYHLGRDGTYRFRPVDEPGGNPFQVGTVGCRPVLGQRHVLARPVRALVTGHPLPPVQGSGGSGEKEPAASGHLDCRCRSAGVQGSSLLSAAERASRQAEFWWFHRRSVREVLPRDDRPAEHCAGSILPHASLSVPGASP